MYFLFISFIHFGYFFSASSTPLLYTQRRKWRKIASIALNAAVDFAGGFKLGAWRDGSGADRRPDCEEFGEKGDVC